MQSQGKLIGTICIAIATEQGMESTQTNDQIFQQILQNSLAISYLVYKRLIGYLEKG